MRVTATNSRDVSLHAISNEHPGTPTAHVTWKPFINGCAAFNRCIALPTRHLQSNRILHCYNGEARRLDGVRRSHDEVFQELHVVGWCELWVFWSFFFNRSCQDRGGALAWQWVFLGLCPVSAKSRHEVLTSSRQWLQSVLSSASFDQTRRCVVMANCVWRNCHHHRGYTGKRVWFSRRVGGEGNLSIVL